MKSPLLVEKVADNLAEGGVTGHCHGDWKLKLCIKLRRRLGENQSPRKKKWTALRKPWEGRKGEVGVLIPIFYGFCA